MLKNQPYADHQSIASSRKALRLSNFNPMRRGPAPNSAATSGRIPDMSAYANQALPPSPAENDEGMAPLSPTTSNYHQKTTFSLQDETNYRLVRMESNKSIDSNFLARSQYKVTLNMNKKEIELIRYTWNKMLLDEPIVEKKSTLPIPGGYMAANGLNSKEKEKSMAYINKTSASTVASSLFCRQFYLNLLQMDPNLEKMFPSIKHQAVSFAGVMSFAISQLELLQNLDDYLISLGKRHLRILGIEPAQFELMGEALIETFHERFGTRFSQELEILWIKLYLYLSNLLLQFGIDPVLRLREDDDFDENYHHLGFGRFKHRSNSTNTLNQSMSDMLVQDGSVMDKRLSISTGVTAATTNSYDNIINAVSGSPGAPLKKRGTVIYSGSDSALSNVLPKDDKLQSKIKKRKRDCVIM